MKKRLISLLLMLVMLAGLLPAVTLKAEAATAPTKLWVEPSETNGIPAQIDVFKKDSAWILCLPGNAVLSECFLSWDGDMRATVDGTSYDSGACPVPPLNTEKTFAFKNGNQTLTSFKVTTYQGSPSVQAVYMDIDESGDNPTIAEMDSDPDHEVTCTGRINIDGQWYDMPKIKGRGNATWSACDDKRPYNVTLDKKITFPGIDAPATKKWSFLAEALDHSLLCNRSGFYLANELGIGQDTASVDVWMNGEYQGCYTVTPKTDSYVTKDGFMIEQDNYKEPAVADGGDPQFTLTGLKEASGWSSCYNRITVKKMGDNLLKNEAGEVDESPENMTEAAEKIQAWLQDAWDAIRSDTGYNSKGKYYTDYIDIESFAKMYLMHEYVKSYDVCAGSILYHRDGQTDSDKLIAGPIWDLDNAMGATYQNSSLGKADDRRNGDRRSAQGSFIANVTEYKTSVYKTLSKHQDFMDEVSFQYNKYRAAFESLPNDVEQMISDIGASAMMNHNKVNDLGHSTGKNLHYYSSRTTLGSGQYQQVYLATTNSKTDWGNYTANLLTYISTRTLWFSNTYYDPDFVDPATCEHQYQETEVPATCTADGSITYTCPICKDTYTEVIPKIPHDYQDGYCAVCNEKLLTAAISCSDGASVTVLETQDPDGPGVENAVTANPRNSDTGFIDCAGDGQINFVAVTEPCYELVSVTAEPATSYKNLKLPADTGITNGYRLTKVKGDLTITVTAAAAHEYEAAVTEPTCTEGGYTTYTCTNCGHSYIDDHVDALGHDLTYHAAKAPTCTEIGWNAYQTCSRCDYTTYEELPALGHTAAAAVTENRVEPACTEPGSYESVVYCSDCGAELSRETAGIDALGHDYGDWTVTTAPTCTEAGEETRVCSRCGMAETRETDALGHHYEAAVTEPTCTEGGYTTYTCSHCGDSYTADETEALGHDYGDWTVTTAPTCTEAGEETRICSHCGIAETREVEALGHDYREVDGSAKAATCTVPGKGPDRKCSRCGDIITGAEIAALGHTEVIMPSTEPTCTESGLTEGIKCSVCGEILTEQETIPATGHHWDEGAETSHAACTENGVKTFTCTDCGETRTETIPALGHIWDDGVITKEPTYIDEGIKTYTCDRCGTTRTESIPVRDITLDMPVIESQTAEAAAHKGEHVDLSVTATNASSYQWQYWNGTKWVNCKSATCDTDTFSFTASGNLDGRQYRCVITGPTGLEAISDPITLIVSTLAITKQPVSQSVPKSTKVVFVVTAAGNTDLAYQWQYSDDGSKWTNCRSTGYDTASFSFTSAASLNGRQYRCRVMDEHGYQVTSDAARLTVSTTTITKQPVSLTASKGEKVTFEATATGTDIGYQWQYSSDGTTWRNCSMAGNNTPSFSFTASAGLNGRQYRCVVTGSDGVAVASKAATLTVTTTTITAQPASATVSKGAKVTLSVKATGTGLTYQWQYSDDGALWKNCRSSGYDAADFAFSATTVLNGRQYRCIVTGSDGIAVTSNAAKLTVK